MSQIFSNARSEILACVSIILSIDAELSTIVSTLLSNENKSLNDISN